MFKIISALLLGSFYLWSLAGCTSLSKPGDAEYFDSVKKFSDRAEFYSGINNVFQVHGTILNTEIQQGQIEKKDRAFSWSDEQKQTEQKKVDESIRQETKVFLSFYSPENRVNNLDSPSSIWRVFLDVNNKRYVGSVSTYVGFANEAELFYPYHTVFAKAYIVKFPVPIAHIQDYPLTLTVTGTIGSKTIQFKPLLR